MRSFRLAPAWCLPGLLTTLLIVAPTSLRAQPRQTRENFNTWLNWFGDVEINDDWAVDFDVSARRSDGFEETGQYLWRFSLRRNVLPNLRVNLGYAGTDTHPYGKLPIAFRAPEHRLFQEVRATQSVARVQVIHRYRFEQRWAGRVAEEDGEERVQNWVRTNRGRYLVKGTIPLEGATLDPGEWYTSFADELFINWGANIQGNVFDQNRITVMLGKRLSDHVRLETGYMEHLVQRPNGRQLERNHTWTTTLTTGFPRKRAAAK